MLELSCPACGAPVRFRSKASVFAVCNFCKTSAVRHDVDLQSIGKMADLQYDLTPFQVGTTGNYDGKKFEIIGRLKVAYSDGFWNEWYTISGDGEVGWLAEAQGFLAMCFELDSNIPPIDEIIPGHVVSIKPHGKFEVEDIRRVHCIYSEGELPLNAAKGRRSNSVDLVSVGMNLKMATIEYADTVRAYVGKYQEFDDFAFENLRKIDGW